MTPHVERRMEDRDFSEVELREMLTLATRLKEDVVEGRFVVGSRLRGREWEIILEPIADEQIVVVVTAYPVEKWS